MTVRSSELISKLFMADPSKITPEMLSHFSDLMKDPETLRKVEEIFNLNSSAPQTKQKLIQQHTLHHQRLLTQFSDVQTQKYFAIPSTLPKNLAMHKPEGFSTTTRREDLLPIQISSLVLNTTHRGRILTGKLVVDPNPMIGVNTVLEDANGSAVLVGIYNMFPDLEGRRLWDAALRYLAKGTSIAILEPFSKIAADGNAMIRVDNPGEVIFLPTDADDAARDWKAHADMGKRQFNGGNMSEAADSFLKALKIQCVPHITAVLKNMSFSCVRLGLSAEAVMCSVVGLCMDRTDAKTRHRLKEALKHIGQSKRLYNALTEEGTERITFGESYIRCVAECMGKDAFTRFEGLGRGEESLEELKTLGNEMFRKGRVDEALELYLNALGSIGNQRVEIAKGLCNTAASLLSLEQNEESYVYSAAVIWLCGIWEEEESLSKICRKAFYRNVTALIALNMNDVAASVLSSACDRFGRCDVFQSLEEKISMHATPETLSAKKLSVKYSEREMREFSQSQKVPAEISSSFNTFAELVMVSASPEQKKKMADMGLSGPDRRVPPFHTEFSRDGLWPSQTDVARCFEMLHGYYEDARACLPSRMQVLLMKDMTKEEKLKRFRKELFNRSFLEWYYASPLGAVMLCEPNPYENRVFHSFGNACVIPTVMRRGETHVAVGFNDLSMLLFSVDVLEGEEGSVLRWIGYEASEYSVAKSLVVLAMLRLAAPVDHILQVWFSSVWTTKTLASFQKAVQSVLSKSTSNISVSVSAILRHWRVTGRIPLKRARGLWLDSQLESWAQIGGFRKKADRMALCAYVLTGELLGGDVGSVVMFSLPRGIGELALDESFLQVFEPSLLFGKRKTLEKDIVQTGIDILRDRIGLLQSKVIGGHVTIEIHEKSVSPEDSATLQEIKSFAPGSMSWSNVSDYVSASSFHRMARECSGGSTVHSMYSMNWVHDVKGAFLLDVPMQRRKAVIAMSEKKTGKYYEESGISEFVLSPPVTHVMNMVDAVLRSMYYTKWLAAFLEKGRVPVDSVEVTSPKLHNPFGRVDGTLYMSFVYGEERTAYSL